MFHALFGELRIGFLKKKKKKTTNMILQKLLTINLYFIVHKFLKIVLGHIIPLGDSLLFYLFFFCFVLFYFFLKIKLLSIDVSRTFSCLRCYIYFVYVKIT